MFSPTALVGYFALFIAFGFVFLFANLFIGRFLRPKAPNVEKLEVYECGEPTIGSSFVQFDLRFYVVALLFIIFDVEVALFFPWANVFGKSTQLMTPELQTYAAVQAQEELGLAGPPVGWTAADQNRHATLADQNYRAAVDATYVEMGIRNATYPGAEAVQSSARKLAWLSLIDISVFFAVLMVGFAYVWSRGDLDWVRAVSRERMTPQRLPPQQGRPTETVLSG